MTGGPGALRLAFLGTPDFAVPCLEALAAAGHDIAADRPQALVNLVSDYLERRETFIVQNRSSVINP